MSLFPMLSVIKNMSTTKLEDDSVYATVHIR